MAEPRLLECGDEVIAAFAEVSPAVDVGRDDRLRTE
jgi:hypothetical protein